jgi:hypothetical protein
LLATLTDGATANACRRRDNSAPRTKILAERRGGTPIGKGGPILGCNSTQNIDESGFARGGIALSRDPGQAAA